MCRLSSGIPTSESPTWWAFLRWVFLIPVIGSCEPDQPDEPGKSEQSAEETAELRQQVNKTYLMGIGSFVLKRRKRENTILLRLNFDRWWRIWRACMKTSLRRWLTGRLQVMNSEKARKSNESGNNRMQSSFYPPCLWDVACEILFQPYLPRPIWAYLKTDGWHIVPPLNILGLGGIRVPFFWKSITNEWLTFKRIHEVWISGTLKNNVWL